MTPYSWKGRDYIVSEEKKKDYIVSMEVNCIVFKKGRTI
jgi:hypothetical protein